MSKTPPIDTESSDYKNLVELLGVFSEATNRLDELQTQANRDFLEIADEHRKEYTALQEKISAAESAIKEVVARNPGWFEKRKSAVTPYGTVKLTSGTKLEVADTEVTVALLLKHGTVDRDFDVSLYVRNEPVLRLEALETMDDAMLEKFKIKRVTTSGVKLEAARVDLGEALKTEQPVKEAA